jgi:hypothetical protein
LGKNIVELERIQARPFYEVEGHLQEQSRGGKIALGGVFLILFILAWHMLANARMVDDEIVTSPQTVQGAPEGLMYSTSEFMTPSKTWPGGRRIRWTGNNMVHLKCKEGETTPPITVRIQDFTNKESSTFECQEGTAMAEPLYQFINSHLKSCLHVGMRAGNIKGLIKSIVIDSKGVHNVRKVHNSSNFSQHSTGRAMDVTSFNVTLDDGSPLVLPASCINNPPGSQREGFDSHCKREGPLGKFYDAFVSCWQDKVGEEMVRCQGLSDPYCKDLQNGAHCSKANGALGCNDKNHDHRDHLHLSLPLCPQQRGIAGS